MRPNILWIVLEDTSPRLGCYGDDIAITPRIDALAEEGRRFDQMFSTTGTCAPSRASLITGMMPQTLGAQHMRTRTHDQEGLVEPYECVPPHYVSAVTEYLRKAGYYCTLDIKTDFQFGEPVTMWDHHARGAGWWDDAREREQPFFAMMTNAVTHESGMWEPSMTPEDREGGLVDSPETAPRSVRVPPYLTDTERTRTAIARQYDNIATLDTWVGEVLDRLEADGHTDNTVVFLVGDHGEGLPRKKRWPYDSGTHVPLIVRMPDKERGESSERLVSGIDIAPTTLSIAGITPPPFMEGRPFLGDEAIRRKFVVTTRDRIDESYDMVRSVRDERFRYVRHYYPDHPFVQYIPYRDRHPAMRSLLERRAKRELNTVNGLWFRNTRPAEELFDLKTDPDELHNLVGETEHAEDLERLRSTLDSWRQEIGDRRLGAESEAAMRRRMWPTGDQPTTASPTFVVHGPEGSVDQLGDDGLLQGPVTIGLYCATQGASLTWSFGDNESWWNLYDGPIHLSPGETRTIWARAIRYGFAQSAVSRQEFRIT